MTQPEPITIPAVLRWRAEQSADGVAMRSLDGRSWTFGDLSSIAGGIADLLRKSDPSGRYGIVMKNCPLLTFGILGASCAGTAMPLNPVYQKDELVDYFRKLRVSTLVIGDEHGAAEAAAETLGLPVVRISGTERGGSFPETDPDVQALVLMTSGSTGEPKLVPLTHRNLCVSAFQVAASVNLSPEDVCLSMWELHHIGGLVDLLLAPIVSGGQIISTGGFDAADFFRAVSEFRPTWFQAVPTTLHDIVSWLARGEVSIDGHGFRFLRSVAAKLPESLQDTLEECFKVPVIQTFGMTEAGPLITSTRLPPEIRKRGSVGTSCGNEIRIFGDAGENVPVGETGEIGIRGDNVFHGYEGAEEENAQRFRGGWFLAGDLGLIDADGHLFLAGRSKQLINRGGEKINPLEVEDVLRTHPSVADAGAFAVEHRTLGEDVAAGVVLKAGHKADEEALRNHVAARLAPFKVPRTILFVDEFPLTSIGKLDRPALAHLAAREGKKSGDAASGIERDLCGIWAREMGLESIGPEENFFSAGGDSLMGVRVMLAVETWLGKPLPPELMMGISTVRDMAAKLDLAGPAEEMLPAKPESPVIRDLRMVMGAGEVPVIRAAPTMKARPKQRDRGAKPPLYWCFNSPDGEMARLSRVWKRRPHLIGMFSGSDGEEEVTREVAAHYASLIVDRRGDKPFFLAGNCRGGRVVAAMVDRLREQGVAPLGVVFLEHAPLVATSVDYPRLFLFGEDTWVPRKNRKVWRKLAKDPSSLVQVSDISGIHGEFFRPKNVYGLKAAVRAFIDPLMKS